MAAELRRFLEQRHFKRSEATPRHTHTNMRAYNGRRLYISCGCYYISDKDYSRFLDLYCLAIRSNRLFRIGMTEVPLPVSSFVLDADWQVPSKIVAQMWRDAKSPAIQFAKLVQSVLKQCFEVSDATVYCLMKPSPRRDGDVWRDGLHLHCPTIPLTFPQKQLARARIMEECQKQDFFPNLERQQMLLPKRLEAVIDQCVADDRCGWMLYGCCKPESHAYRIIAKLKHDGSVKLNPRSRTSDIIRRFSMRIPKKTALLTKEAFKTLVNNATERRVRRIKQRTRMNEEIDPSIRLDRTTHEELQETLIKLLKVAPQTACDFLPWFRVGAVIHNHEPLHGFNTFLWFSKQGGDKYRGRADVEQQWNSYRRTAEPTIRLLRFWIQHPESVDNFPYIGIKPAIRRKRMDISVE